MKQIKKLCFLLLIIFSFACGHSFSQNTIDEKKVSSCILLGNDSIAYYYDSSNRMKELLKGNINDSVFLDRIIKSIKNHSIDKDFKVAFKPTNAEGVKNNVVALINLFNANDIDNRFIDTLDNKEKQFFNAANMPDLVADLNQEPTKLKLILPESQNDSSANSNSKSTITLILYDANNIYSYEGNNLDKGKLYSYSDIDNYIKQEIKKFPSNEFNIIIKPTSNTSYTNTIDILDKIKTNNVYRYSLLDLSKEERAFLETLR